MKPLGCCSARGRNKLGQRALHLLNSDAKSNDVDSDDVESHPVSHVSSQLTACLGFEHGGFGPQSLNAKVVTTA